MPKELVSFRVPLALILIGFFIINIIVAIYYIGFAKKFNILSLGERIAGRIISEWGKKWENPYYVNRIGIFLLSAFSVVILAASFRGALFGKNIYAVSDIVIKLSIIVVYMIGLSIIGK